MKTHRIGRARFANAPWFLVCLALAALLPGFLDAQSSDFDAVASRLSASISVSSGGLAIKPSVLVMDFIESHGAPNQLGPELAMRFSKSLAQNARDFVVANGDKEFEAFRSARAMAPSSNGTSAADCSVGQLKPTIEVDGYIDNLTDRLTLRIKATRIEDRKIIFDERITLALTSELETLESRPVSINGSSPVKEGIVWNRPGFKMPDAGSKIPLLTNSEDKDYVGPRCLQCPHADYPDQAMAAKIQGTVTLRVLIDPEGHPARIILVEGLPCGLSDRAVETVAGWTLSPATGPDGKPMAVWVEIKVNFQLFS